jgi:hypothetical protein
MPTWPKWQRGTSKHAHNEPSPRDLEDHAQGEQEHLRLSKRCGWMVMDIFLECPACSAQAVIPPSNRCFTQDSPNASLICYLQPVYPGYGRGCCWKEQHGKCHTQLLVGALLVGAIASGCFATSSTTKPTALTLRPPLHSQQHG